MARTVVPFSAWVKSVHSKYADVTTSRPFVVAKTFVKLWVEFVRLQDLKADLGCPTCGPNPRHVIADGLTLAYLRRHMLPTLHPPTRTTEESEVRLHHAVQEQQVFQPKVRKALRRALEAYSLETLAVSDREDFDISTQALQIMVDMHGDDEVEAQLALDLLNSVDTGFTAANLPRRQFRSVMAPIILLLKHASAVESCLQMAPPPGHRYLRQFATRNINTHVQADALARRNPAFAQTWRGFTEADIVIPNSIVSLGAFVYNRAFATAAQLSDGNRAYPAFAEAESDWRITGSSYGQPKIRLRPKYRNIDKAPREKAAPDERSCQKHYDAFGKGRLTGGVLALWCTHGYCLGWHAIPFGEGRNDVFAAIFSHWETAPLVIVYDFACSLAPYSLNREYDFYRNTLFAIDELHQHDHSRCSSACFLDTYMSEDPDLLRLKSSIAECGNAGLKRIRKSVSYCGQRNALAVIGTYLFVWNRFTARGERPKAMQA
ncbi:hypothetical protein P7C70_g9056, partial [Phenoliferia sp. Uapishka_3]